MNRSLLSTSIDTELLQEFRKICKAKGEHMNTILEVFIRAYIDGDIDVDRIARVKNRKEGR